MIAQQNQLALIAGLLITVIRQLKLWNLAPYSENFIKIHWQHFWITYRHTYTHKRDKCNQKNISHKTFSTVYKGCSKGYLQKRLSTRIWYNTVKQTSIILMTLINVCWYRLITSQLISINYITIIIISLRKLLFLNKRRTHPLSTVNIMYTLFGFKQYDFFMQDLSCDPAPWASSYDCMGCFFR